MKHILFIAIILVLQIGQVHAQHSTKVLLQGKYELSLENSKNENGYLISILNNLPGIYSIQAVVDIKDSLGQSKTIHIDKRQVGAEFVICQMKEQIQSITFKSITLNYQQFGEMYSLNWSQQTGGLNFTKQGKEYSYANPFTLHSNEFTWNSTENNMGNLYAVQPSK